MKKIMIVLSVAIGAMFAQAEDSILWWMLDATPTEGETFADGWWASAANYSVTVSPKSGGVIGDFLSYAGGGQESQARANFSYATILGNNPTASSYLIELWTDSETDSPSYAAELSVNALANYIKMSGDHAPQPFLVTQNMFHAVPEPTSGMMMLLGLALLGLKRKQKLA